MRAFSAEAHHQATAHSPFRLGLPHPASREIDYPGYESTEGSWERDPAGMAHRGWAQETLDRGLGWNLLGGRAPRKCGGGGGIVLSTEHLYTTCVLALRDTCHSICGLPCSVSLGFPPGQGQRHCSGTQSLDQRTQERSMAKEPSAGSSSPPQASAFQPS